MLSYQYTIQLKERYHEQRRKAQSPGRIQAPPEGGLPRLTEAFLTNHGCDTEAVLTWLEDHGGSCDCEVLANIEEQFDN